MADKDPVIARLVAETGLPRLGRSKQSHFAALVQAVVYQQLAGRAAAAIHGRLIVALDGQVEPGPLLTLSDEALRAVGLSANKAASSATWRRNSSMGPSCSPRVGWPGRTTRS